MIKLFNAVKEIKKQEGFRSHAYKLQGEKCITIGYGTYGTYPSTGLPVQENDTINEEDAEFEVYQYCQKYIVPYIEKCNQIWLEQGKPELTENQIIAICSRRYNSSSFFKSKCWKAILNCDQKTACQEWDWWKFVAPIYQKGVKKRCNREIELFYGIKNYWK